jgi:outer membrane protein OmpA-like peptidoglycan-associated protein
MADLEDMTPGEILADSSVADFIRELGLGIAAAQAALDDNSIRQMEIFTTRRDDLGGRSLLDLGLTPAFYHYQHADITCSMQLRMEVGKSDELGFGIRAGFNDQNNSQNSSNEERTTTQRRELNRSQSAELTMTAESEGALAITGGSTFTPTGSTPTERLQSLQSQLVASGGEVNRLVFRPPETRPDMSLDPVSDKVVVNSPTVTFLRPDSDRAVIRIAENQATDYVVNGSLTINTTAQADLAAYADHVLAQFRALPEPERFRLSLLFAPGPRVKLVDAHYDTGIHSLRPVDADRLKSFARFLVETGQVVEVEGFTDRQGSQAMNLELGAARARGVRDHLLAQGVPAGQVRLADPVSRGERAADDAGDADGLDNQDWRLTEVYAVPLSHYLLFVGASGTHDFDPALIAPDATNGAGTPTNAYISLYKDETLGLSSNELSVDDETFTVSGAAVAGVGAVGTAEAYAANLTTAINASATHRAWRTGNVVRVARSGDNFAVQLFATSERELSVARSSNFTITRQFERTTRSVESNSQESNRQIAVGVSVDGRFSRQFNQEVTGNSSISARLVSIPAPPEFLEQIRDFQNSLD